MNLKDPVIICPNLEPGVRIGSGSYVTIRYSSAPAQRNGRARYRYTIMRDGKPDVVGDDIESGVGNTSLWSGLHNLLGFLSAFGEANRPGRRKLEDDNSDLFPQELAEWAYLNADELALASMMVEENRDCIVE